MTSNSSVIAAKTFYKHYCYLTALPFEKVLEYFQENKDETHNYMYMALKHQSLPLFQLSRMHKDPNLNNTLLQSQIANFKYIHSRQDDLQKFATHKQMLQVMNSIQDDQLCSPNFLYKLQNCLPKYCAPFNHQTLVHRQSIKKVYTEILIKICAYHSSENQQFSILFLFPPQLFNITDTMIVNRIAKKWIIPSLSYTNIHSIQNNLIWLNRFNLQAYAFIQKSLQRIQQILANQQLQISSKLTAINCLYLIHRKIYPHSQSIANTIKQIFLKTNFYDLLININPNQLHQKLVDEVESKNIRKLSLLEILSQQQQINKQLFRDRIKIDYKEIKKGILVKLLRSYLLLLDFSLLEQDLQKIRNIFSTPLINNFIEQFCYQGDISAQIMYLHEKLKVKQKQFLPPTLLHTLHNNVISSFNQIIKQKQFHSKLTTFHINQSNHFQLSLRLQKLQNCLLFGQENNKENRQANKEDKIILSLLNDNQFLGTYHLSDIVKKKVGDKILSNIRNHLEPPKQLYPFYPDFMYSQPAVSQSQKHPIFIKNSLCHKSRTLPDAITFDIFDFMKKFGQKFDHKLNI